MKFITKTLGNYYKSIFISANGVILREVDLDKIYRKFAG